MTEATAPVSVFATWQKEHEFTTTYNVEIQLLDRIVGGTPSDVDAIAGWLKSKMGILDEEELKAQMRRTVIELGIPIPETATTEQMKEAIDKVVSEKHTNRFKVNPAGEPIIESRCGHAMLKENCNILFAGARWTGAFTQKAARSIMTERVTVSPLQIRLADRISGTFLFVGHTNGPSGPQSNLTMYEYVSQPRIAFSLEVIGDVITQDAWAAVWSSAERNGFGSLRSQDFGRFVITKWQRVETGIRPWAPEPNKAPVAKGKNGKGTVAAVKAAETESED